MAVLLFVICLGNRVRLFVFRNLRMVVVLFAMIGRFCVLRLIRRKLSRELMSICSLSCLLVYPLLAVVLVFRWLVLGVL